MGRVSPHAVNKIMHTVLEIVSLEPPSLTVDSE